MVSERESSSGGMGRLHLTTGDPTPDADIFHVTLSDMEADVCNYQPSTGVVADSRPIISRSGTSSLTVQKASVLRPADTAELDVRGTISKITLVVSDELLLSVNGIVSSIASKRQSVLAEIAEAGDISMG